MLKVVFDVDDVLNNLLEHSFELANLNKEKYVNKKRYYLEECDDMTAEEANKLYELWRKVETYDGCKPQEGISEIGTLKDKFGVKVVIHSHCMNSEVGNSKISWLNKHINTDGIEIIMEVKSKNTLDNAFIVVEDNLEYLLKYDAPYRLLINKHYNKFENYDLNESCGIKRFNTTSEAIRFIKEILSNGESRCKNI